MAMADLARHSGSGSGSEPVRLCEIAARQEISLSYLEQLFGKLRRGGLVLAARGPGGGYRPAQPAAGTRILRNIIAVGEPIEATRCRSHRATRMLRPIAR